MTRLRGKALRLEPQIRGRSTQGGTENSATANTLYQMKKLTFAHGKRKGLRRASGCLDISSLQPLPLSSNNGQRMQVALNVKRSSQGIQ